MSTRRRVKNELFYGYNRLGPEVHEHTDKAARVAVRLSERAERKLKEHSVKSHEFVSGKRKEVVEKVKHFGMRIINPFSEVIVGEKKGKKKSAKKKR